jgi:hypothetical protein
LKIFLEQAMMTYNITRGWSYRVPLHIFSKLLLTAHALRTGYPLT